MYIIKEGERKKEIVVMVERWEIKRQIMKKKELEKKYTYDLTKKEREMQRIIRKITKEEKKERKRSKS